MCIKFCEETKEYCYSVVVTTNQYRELRSSKDFWNFVPMGGYVNHYDGMLWVYGYDCESFADKDRKSVIELIKM